MCFHHVTPSILLNLGGPTDHECAREVAHVTLEDRERVENEQITQLDTARRRRAAALDVAKACRKITCQQHRSAGVGDHRFVVDRIGAELGHAMFKAGLHGG